MLTSKNLDIKQGKNYSVVVEGLLRQRSRFIVRPDVPSHRTLDPGTRTESYPSRLKRLGDRGGDTLSVLLRVKWVLARLTSVYHDRM